MYVILKAPILNFRDHSYTEIERHELIGVHSSTINATVVGKYTCKISLLLKAGLFPYGSHGGLRNEWFLVGSAYHYIPVTVEVFITITSPSEETPRVDREKVNSWDPYLLLLSDKVQLHVELSGYPFPRTTIESSTSHNFVQVRYGISFVLCMLQLC